MIVELKGVTKLFPGVKALDNVDLTIRSGEILGLIGENGAGKSTLMKILSGVYANGTYEGQITIDGTPVAFSSPSDAESHGVAIIHQELSTFPDLTVAENLFVGHWPKAASGMVDWQRLNQMAQTWLDTVGAPCRADEKIGDLSIGTQQLIEIAKALSRQSKVLILDEPTSSLTPTESAKLFQLLRDLRLQGKAMVYISHKMEEIFALCDRLTVLRDGQTVCSFMTTETNPDGLIEHMVGRAIQNIYPPAPKRKFGNPILELNEYRARLPERAIVLGPLSFQIRAGEIFGIGGLLGAGRTELVKAIFGDETAEQLGGEVRFLDEVVKFLTPQAALRRGLSYVSEDRKGESILPERSLIENAGISRLAVFFRGLRINHTGETERARTRLGELSTKHSSLDQSISQLSGGNQQKVIIARAMDTDAKLIILDEPTRGIDVKAKSEIYEIIFQLATQGRSILMISSDLPELMALSDRIAMMREGQLMGILAREQFSQVALMQLAVGNARKEAMA